MKLIQRLTLASAVLLLAACATVAPPQKPPTPVTQSTPAAEPVAPVPRKIPKLGLALGGGAARGFAHIGVLQVLEEEGIKPAMVVGTSAGSVVASFYASGKTSQQLLWLADTMDESQFTDWANPFSGRGTTAVEGGGVYRNFSDSWKNEVAAYELDKLLGTRLVPPTVERTISGSKGSLQMWVEGVMTEADRQDCNRWATTQPSAMNDAGVFNRAVDACMDGRGYTLR